MLSFLTMAVWTDHREHRIPNLLVLAMIIIVLVLQITAAGTGGLVQAAFGILAGLTVFLIPYAMGGMAAGDVKLLAATGAFLGPGTTLVAGGFALITGALIAGGVIAYQNSRGISSTTERILSTRFPFAGAIAIGVSTTLLLRVSL
jgi:prepilin peptidase CpaA